MISPECRDRCVGLLVGCALATLLAAAPARAHDPSAWGGIYRTRDDGGSWLLANEGRFVTGALDLAISPADPNHLLLATDSGLLRSRNGGRDWGLEAEDTLVGGVFAVTFDADGRRALASSTNGIFWTDDGPNWRRSPVPPGAAPARAIVRAPSANDVYLAGWSGLFRSDDWGLSWSALGNSLPEGWVGAIVTTGTPHEAVLVVAAGELWVSFDGARSWQPRGNGLPRSAVDTLALDARRTDRVWAAAADRLFHSDDLGGSWHPVGNPLSERGTAIRGIGASASGDSIVLSTDRGLFRSSDRGQSWALLVDNLPVHLEARPLVRDPHDPATMYAGFSITPYDELWQRAAGGGTALDRLDPLNLAGAVAFLLLLALAAAAALSRLARYYRPGAEAAFQNEVGG